MFKWIILTKQQNISKVKIFLFNFTFQYLESQLTFIQLYKMREIVQVQIGGCGNYIGNNFLETISDQHKIQPDGTYTGNSEFELQRLNVYYNELQKGKYNSRAIHVDLEPGVLDSLHAQKNIKLNNPNNFIYGRGGTGNIWAKGYYTVGSEIIDSLLDAVRRQSQSCDSLQAFQLIHSLSGGTGSGLTSLFLQKIQDQYPHRIKQTFSIYPSSNSSTNIFQCYNSVLSHRHLVENTHICHIFDNQSLQTKCQKFQKITFPTYKDLNKLVADAMSNVTCSLRFPGQVNTDLRKIATNIIPFPRVHFFMLSNGPYKSLQSQKYNKISVEELINQLFQPKSIMCQAKPNNGRYLTASLILRGQISSNQAEMKIRSVQNKNSSYFIQWIPYSVQSALCNVPSKNKPISGVMIGNNTAIQSIFTNSIQKFTAMFRKKAYLHWYTGQGMEEMQFTEAESNMNDLASEYQMGCCDCGIQDSQQQYDYE